MSSNLQIYSRFDTRINEAPINGGSLELPVSISVAGKVHNLITTVNSNTNSVIYNDVFSGFTFLWIQATRTTRLKFTTSGTNTRVLDFEIVGSSDNLSYGPPFILTSDDTYDADAVAARIAIVTAYNEDTTSGNDSQVLIKVFS